jgi:hypothetical protein
MRQEALPRQGLSTEKWRAGVDSAHGRRLKMAWISDTGGDNLHRNVIFHENGAREFDIQRTA